MLSAWDARRAAAWRDGDATALRRLYVRGSDAGQRDVANLQQWRGRGLRPRISQQLLSVRVLDQTPIRWRLRVTDRLVIALADRSARLPVDRPSTRDVVLVRNGRWRVASVSEVQQR